MITTVSTTAELTAALKGAHGGDTIQLASGSYSAVAINGLHFAQDVTITGATGANAVVNGLDIYQSNGLTFSNLEFTATPAMGAVGMNVASSQDIHFDSIRLHGSLDGDPTNDTGGLMLRESSNVSVTHSTFEQLYWGIGHSNDSGVTISGNTIHDMRMDGIRGGGSSNVTVSDNVFKSFHPVDGDHDDAIQFWTTNTTTSAHDIVVKNNVFERGDGKVVQGVFLNNEVAGLPYQNVTISGNLVVGGAYNGIYVKEGSNVQISDNVVQGYTDQTSWIYVGKVNGAYLVNNYATHYIIDTAATNVSQVGSTVLNQATDGGAYAINLWNSLQSGATAPASATAGSAGVLVTGTSTSEALTGGAGADTLVSGGGTDTLSGGAGDDLYVVNGYCAVTESAGGGVDTVQGAATIGLAANVENAVLTGTVSAWATGNGLNNVLTGNDGANRMSGLAGNDTISGGGRSDTIIGGAGDDQLTGGTDADVFVFAKGDGHDVITDFGAGGAHDVLDLSALYGAGLTPTLTDGASGVTISFSSGDSILLSGVHPSSLHATSTGYIF
ncbi:MAG TPA: right-handed parallel beta-helix repeat-containing protein [Phenylobacterium sp.]|nr:right-handed parallel beta-helix repeat-containing protein [Phenylobacterium sp.]